MMYAQYSHPTLTLPMSVEKARKKIGFKHTPRMNLMRVEVDKADDILSLSSPLEVSLCSMVDLVGSISEFLGGQEED